MHLGFRILAGLAVTVALASGSTAKSPSKSAKPAPQADEQKFDLLCDSHSVQTGEKYNDEHLRIDLKSSTWCRADHDDCEKPKELIVLNDELWMYRGLISKGSWGLEIDNHYVNRRTGLMRFERDLNGVSSTSEGMCSKLPYGADVPNKF